jgi:general secretion pathway protein G
MKKPNRIKKRYITLIEIMIVMFLIALIMGVLAYNYQGSLEQGKVFKTKAAIDRLETILNLAVAEEPGLISHISQDWESVVDHSPLVHNPKDMKYDAWGFRYRVEVDQEGHIQVTSEGLSEYQKKRKSR